MNAATFDMAEQLQEAFAEVERDDRRSGGRPDRHGGAFCAGDDVEKAWGDDRMAATLRELADVRPGMTPEAAMFLDCRKPTIAAVNGAAVGVGMDFALLCDIRIASEHAKFAQLYVKLGLMADVTGYWRLPQLVGYAKAAELLFTGDLVDATEAERIGLVSQVVPADELLAAAQGSRRASPPTRRGPCATSRRACAGRGPQLHGAARRLGRSSPTGWRTCSPTEDHKEAAAAFMEKRPAMFTGLTDARPLAWSCRTCSPSTPPTSRPRGDARRRRPPGDLRRAPDTYRTWAGALRRLGVGAGRPVVTMLPNSFEAYYAWLGAAWLGAIEVPANNMYRGDMLRHLLEDSRRGCSSSPRASSIGWPASRPR